MNNRTAMAAIITLAAQLFTQPSAVADPPEAEHRVLAQEGAPIVISAYSAGYQPRESFNREGIRHFPIYRNVSTRKKIALQFGLLAFDIFNEFQDRLGGYTIQDVDPGATAKGSWAASARAESAFHTGVAYLSKVRYEDGEVWSADLDNVTMQVQKIEAGFSVESLQSRQDEPSSKRIRFIPTVR